MMGRENINLINILSFSSFIWIGIIYSSIGLFFFKALKNPKVNSKPICIKCKKEQSIDNHIIWYNPWIK